MNVTDIQLNGCSINSYITCVFTIELPVHLCLQVLLGVKDNNDSLVELSLRALADMVPLLGGDTVIGCHRVRIFAEGKPNVGTFSFLDKQIYILSVL